jgi:tripeptidyl-peptidase I
MLLSRLLLCISITATSYGAPSSSRHEVHERRHGEHNLWEKRERVQATDVFPMRIGLTQSNLDRAHSLLMDVSDPDSPSYAKYLTQEEVIGMFAPAAETVSAVKEWLIASGISEKRITLTDNKAWLAFDASVKEAEELLHTEYFKYKHSKRNSITAACDE